MNCNICPRQCDINRYNETGFCKSSDKVKVNIYQLHYGEEPIISGSKGSGTIFFAGCNLQCVYCQNYEISYHGHGSLYRVEELSDMMLQLQKSNAHNINLVTPSHFTLQIRDAIILAKEKGLTIPVVWNSNAYEEPETLKLLNGLVDIYMPDFKYYDGAMSLKYSQAEDYPERAKRAILEMYRQVGHIQLNKRVAVKGILIRLLVLPQDINGIAGIIKWIYDNPGNQTYISLMGQYYPTHNAGNYPELCRSIKMKEYESAVSLLEKYGFCNGFIQDVGSSSDSTPDFK